MKKYISVIIVAAICLFYLIYREIKKIIPYSGENKIFCPQKVISLNVGLDEITHFIAGEKVVGLSYLSFDPKISNIDQKLKNIKPMKVEIENILRNKPDMLFLSKFSNTNLINVLVQNGIKVEFFHRFESLKDIEDNIKRIAKVTCNPTKGRKLLKWIKGIKNRLKKKCRKIKKE